MIYGYTDMYFVNEFVIYMQFMCCLSAFDVHIYIRICQSENRNCYHHLNDSVRPSVPIQAFIVVSLIY